MYGKTPIDFDRGDDLGDMLGGSTPSNGPRQMPADEQFARIRDRGIGHEPAAEVFKVKCQKCGGSGRFISYAGRDCGPCHACKGKGHHERKTAPEKLAANRERVADNKARKMIGNWEAFQAAHPERAAWLEAKAPTFNFAAEVLQKIAKFGDLFESTLAALDRFMAQDAERAAARAATQAKAAGVYFPNLRAAFDTVIANGAKKARMQFETIVVSIASAQGRNAGALYVKQNGEYAGKIVNTPNGPVFEAAHGIGPDVLAALVVIEADPQGAIKAQADKTAKRLAEAQAKGETLTLPCGCCGIMLTDPESVRRGIGPICAGKWGF